LVDQVDLVKYGKLVTELMMLIEGDMRCAYMEEPDGASHGEPDPADGGAGQLKVESVYAVAEGELIGEVAFFTEAPAQETVSTVTVCRIMVISRTAWNHILERHSSGAEQMLKNLNRYFPTRATLSMRSASYSFFISDSRGHTITSTWKTRFLVKNAVLF
jgi:hypothetical protein